MKAGTGMAQRILFLITLATITASAQLTVNVLDRTIMIRVGSTLGSAFTVDESGRQYVVTAKHLIQTLAGEAGTVEYRTNTGWTGMNVKVLRCGDTRDVAVLIPPNRVTGDFPLPTSTRFSIDEPVSYAGFPRGRYSTANNAIRPIPIVNTGSISGVRNPPFGNGEFTIDGHNLGGFSGGPIVRRTDQGFVAIGVVSGLDWEPAPVLLPTEIAEDQVTPEDLARQRIYRANGRVFRLNETGFLVKQPTGVTIGHPIGCAMELIKQAAEAVQ